MTAGSQWRCKLLPSFSSHQGQADWHRLMGRCEAKRGGGQAPRGTLHLIFKLSLFTTRAPLPPILLQTGLTLPIAVEARSKVLFFPHISLPSSFGYLIFKQLASALFLRVVFKTYSRHLLSSHLPPLTLSADRSRD